MSAAVTAPAYPEHLRSQVERYLEQLHFSHEPATAGLDQAIDRKSVV